MTHRTNNIWWLLLDYLKLYNVSDIIGSEYCQYLNNLLCTLNQRLYVMFSIVLNL